MLRALAPSGGVWVKILSPLDTVEHFPDRVPGDRMVSIKLLHSTSKLFVLAERVTRKSSKSDSLTP